MTYADGLRICTVSFNDRLEVLVYDLHAGRLADDLTDYSIFLSRQEQLNEKTVLNRMYHLKRFWGFLRSRKIVLDTGNEASDASIRRQRMQELSDLQLAEFRDAELTAVQGSVRSKGKERTAKETVNARLYAAYAWLCWLQQDGRVQAGLIGARGARIRSTLPDRAMASGLVQRGYRLSGMAQTDYPLLFRRTGKLSKHKRAYVPSGDDRLKVVELMQTEASSPFIAHRNVLIVDIANATGLRRASINSLCAEQFMPPAEGDYVYVTPSQQKFCYDDSFAFPVWLYLRVQQYCRDYLRPMSETRCWTPEIMRGRIFLSARDGRPLADRTLTQILRSYMRRAAGAPPGAAVHAFRHRFVNEEIRKETLYRVAAGLDTSTTAIATAVSLRVGHKNPESLYPYVAYYQSIEFLREPTSF